MTVFFVMLSTESMGKISIKKYQHKSKWQNYSKIKIKDDRYPQQKHPKIFPRSSKRIL
jgi:predicted double-glycine peptidase